MRKVDTDQFCCKICFVTIYAYLSQNMFFRDSRAFAWRKVKPKFVPVEKKGQISGMIRILNVQTKFGQIAFLHTTPALPGRSRAFKGLTRVFQGFPGPSGPSRIFKESSRHFQDLQGSLRAFQGSYLAFQDLKKPSRAFNESPRALQDTQGPPRAFRSLPGPSKSLLGSCRSFLGLEGPSRNFKECPRAFQYHQQPSKTFKELQRPSEAFIESSSVFQDRQGPSKSLPVPGPSRAFRCFPFDFFRFSDPLTQEEVFTIFCKSFEKQYVPSELSAMRGMRNVPMRTGPSVYKKRLKSKEEKSRGRREQRQKTTIETVESVWVRKLSACQQVGTPTSAIRLLNDNTR